MLITTLASVAAAVIDILVDPDGTDFDFSDLELAPDLVDAP